MTQAAIPPTSTTSALLAVEHLTKVFPSVRALNDVSLQFAAGEIHGLVGENGAGKSTLMRILAGIETPTAGQVRFAGKPVTLRRPADALKLGIAMIHQELNLVDDLNVAENVFLGREPRRLGLVDHRTMRREAHRHLAELGCRLDPRTLVRHLPMGPRQLIEIAKAMSCAARVLILDEPTAVLSEHDAAALFALVHRLRAQGLAIIYISHHLSEVLALCDRVTVLRDGRWVTTLPVCREDAAKNETPDAAENGFPALRPGPAGETRLASLMVGRPLADHFPPRVPPQESTAFAVRGLTVPGWVNDVSLTVRQGEIFGLAGLIGAGRTELAEAIVGLRARSAGEIEVHGKPVAPRSPRAAVAAGIAYLSEDRRGRGLTLGMSVAANITLVALRRYCKPLLSRRAEEDAARAHVRQLAIKTPSLRTPIDTLSGGNQQKVALAKWLEVRPAVLILDEPTRGVDIGAKEEIYRLIQRLAQTGMTCLVISSELNELLGLCHRIAVMRQGRLVATLDGPTATEEAIMHHAAGVAGAGNSSP